MALLTALLSAAEEPNAQYLRVLALIQQADSLNTSGQAGPALAKYQEALVTLKVFQRLHPDMNVKVVAYRLDYLTEKIAALSEKPSPPVERIPAAGTNAAPSETKSPARGPLATSTPQVKLLEAGDEPRAVLRLHPKPGDRQALTMTVKMATDMKIGEVQAPSMKMPAMKMTMDLTVKNVSAAGDIAYETVLSDVSVTEEPGVLAQVAEAMKSSLASLKGMTNAGTTSNRGFSKRAETKAPPGTSPQVRQVMDQVKESLASVVVLLPEEAVGPGARWEVRMPFKSQGMTLDQTTIYQLVALEGDRLTAKSIITQRAADQKIQNPALPGQKLDLIKMAGNGTGNVTFNLAQLLPTEASADYYSQLSLGMNVGGQKQTMAMKVDTNLRFEGKEPAATQKSDTQKPEPEKAEPPKTETQKSETPKPETQNPRPKTKSKKQK